MRICVKCFKEEGPNVPFLKYKCLCLGCKKDRQKIYVKEYNNRPEVKQRAKIYKEENKQSIKDKLEKDKEIRKIKGRIYREKNKELIKERWKKYYEENSEKIRERKRSKQYKFKRKKIPPTPVQKILGNLRTRLKRIIKGKIKTSSEKLTGIERSAFIKHIESLWQEGMNWDNYGVYKVGQPMTWHIDHIIPCDAFDLTIKENQLKCFHYINLQPLWAIDNLLKSNKI